MKYSIEILPHQKTIKTEANRTLGECLQAANTNIRFDCNRLGLCGKCVVQILQGHLPPPNEEEKFFLSETQLQNRFRLACLFTVQSDLKIKIPESSTVQEQLILKTGYGAPVQVDSAVKKFLLKLTKPTIAEPHSLVEIIRKGLKNHHLAVGPGVLKSFVQKRDVHHPQITAVVHKNCELFAIEEGNTLDCCFGFAVDLGTTTIVVELIDLKTGESVGIRAGEKIHEVLLSKTEARNAYLVSGKVLMVLPDGHPRCKPTMRLEEDFEYASNAMAFRPTAAEVAEWLK